MRPAPQGTPQTDDHAPANEDGVLDSIGKAITDPVKTGAEDEEEALDDSVGTPKTDR